MNCAARGVFLSSVLGKKEVCGTCWENTAAYSAQHFAVPAHPSPSSSLMTEASSIIPRPVIGWLAQGKQNGARPAAAAAAARIPATLVVDPLPSINAALVFFSS